MPAAGRIFELFVSPSNLVALLYNFDVDSSVLKPEHNDWLAKTMKSYFSSSKHRGTMIGLASRTGRSGHNMTLSRARAHAVEAAVLRLDPNVPRIRTYVKVAAGEELARIAGQADNMEDGRWRGVLLKIGDPKPWKPRVPARPKLPLPKLKRRTWVKHFLTDNVKGIPQDAADKRADRIAEASRQFFQTTMETIPSDERWEEYTLEPGVYWKLISVSAVVNKSVSKLAGVKASIEWLEVFYVREIDKGQPCRLFIDGVDKGQLSDKEAIDWADRPLMTYRRRWLRIP